MSKWGLLSGFGQGLNQAGGIMMADKLDRMKEERLQRYQQELQSQQWARDDVTTKNDQEFRAGLLQQQMDAEQRRFDQTSAQAAFNIPVQTEDGNYSVLMNRDGGEVARINTGPGEMAEWKHADGFLYNPRDPNQRIDLRPDNQKRPDHVQTAFDLVKSFHSRAYDGELSPEETRLYEHALGMVSSYVGYAGAETGGFTGEIPEEIDRQLRNSAENRAKADTSIVSRLPGFRGGYNSLVETYHEQERDMYRMRQSGQVGGTPENQNDATSSILADIQRDDARRGGTVPEGYTVERSIPQRAASVIGGFARNVASDFSEINAAGPSQQERDAATVQRVKELLGSKMLPKSVDDAKLALGSGQLSPEQEQVLRDYIGGR
jgi:hypothetical protein